MTIKIHEIELKDGTVLKKNGTDWSHTSDGVSLRPLSPIETRVLTFVDAAIAATAAAHQAHHAKEANKARPLEAGDKVFVLSEQKLATVLDVYGDGLKGSFGDVRLDLCGNTAIDNLDRYDAKRHAAFDATFVPIEAKWKETYGITADIPVREPAAQNKKSARP